jgi:hypothetical protein
MGASIEQRKRLVNPIVWMAIREEERQVFINGDELRWVTGTRELTTHASRWI